LTILSCDDESWWEGELNGNVGWFPSNYIEIISEEEAAEVFLLFFF